jgi:hypothetical protein
MRSLRYLILGVLPMVLVGCISVGESKSERELVASFSGDPHIEGRYSALGRGRWWNGSSFQDIRGNLGSLLRDESQRFGYACDTVVFRRGDGGGITIEFEAKGRTERTIHLSAGPNYAESSKWISLKIRRAPDAGEISESVELLFAADRDGTLQVLERKDIKMMTGIGIPIVPVSGKEVASYSFARK